MTSQRVHVVNSIGYYYRDQEMECLVTEPKSIKVFTILTFTLWETIPKISGSFLEMESIINQKGHFFCFS